MRRIVFVLEVLFLAFLSILLGLLVAVIVTNRASRTNLLVPLAGGYGLGSLWWLLLACRPGRIPPHRIPVAIGIGLVVGLGVTGYLFAGILSEHDPALTAQAFLYFGPPVAMCVHLLVRYRAVRTRAERGPSESFPPVR